MIEVFRHFLRIKYFTAVFKWLNVNKITITTLKLMSKGLTNTFESKKLIKTTRNGN